jgi:hypothetical protein
MLVHIVSNANCSSCVLCSFQGVLETVARRVTKKNETNDKKYATTPYLNLFSLLDEINPAFKICSRDYNL